MTRKILAIFVGILGIVAFLSSANAQRVELILQDDQLLKGGRNALQAGNYERALYYYEEALKRKSLSRVEQMEVHNELCVTYIYFDRFEEAIEQCEAALDIQSNRWQTYNNLGTVYLVMGDYENAVQVYEKALKMKPKSQILQFNLELAQKRLHRNSANHERQEPDGRDDNFSSFDGPTNRF